MNVAPLPDFVSPPGPKTMPRNSMTPTRPLPAFVTTLRVWPWKIWTSPRNVRIQPWEATVDDRVTFTRLATVTSRTDDSSVPPARTTALGPKAVLLAATSVPSRTAMPEVKVLSPDRIAYRPRFCAAGARQVPPISAMGDFTFRVAPAKTTELRIGQEDVADLNLREVDRVATFARVGDGAA